MNPEKRRISPLRILIMVILLAAGGVFVWSQASAAYSRLTTPSITTWFAPYVDATLTPTFHFEDPIVNPLPYSVLGFVVADPHDGCTPTWGTYYSLDGAGRELDLDRRITRLRARGGDVAISFGGAVNQELAVACTSPSTLLAAYRTVVDRYGVRTIEFDIEGAAQSDAASNARRAAAIRALQLRASSHKRSLAVWLTLPVTPQGLTRAGISVVNSMILAHVKLGGVNALIMNYGGSLPAGQSMAAANDTAIHSVFRQLTYAYQQAGKHLTSRQIWRRIGATPMIGRNDVDGEYFSLSDAQALVDLARQVHLGRVSMWSANRDYQCSVNADTTRVSNVCSGINQDSLAFTWELGRLNGHLPKQVSVPSTSIAVRPPSRDDPRTSPYAIWVPSGIYVLGDKVVWHGEIYEAKWWTQADVPDLPVKHLWDTPWRDLGPVLVADARSANTVTSGTPFHWSADQVYLTGDRVIDHGYIFEARWWTQGEEPVVRSVRPKSASWVLVRRFKTSNLLDTPTGN